MTYQNPEKESGQQFLKDTITNFVQNKINDKPYVWKSLGEFHPEQSRYQLGEQTYSKFLSL